MTTVGVLIGALVLIVLVLFWSGRYGRRGRGSGTSLRRGPNAHTTQKGRPKMAYATRAEATARARLLTQRDGASMGVYQCATCAKWHVGHDK